MEYRRAVHPPAGKMKREALEEYTREFPVRDYVPAEQLEERPFLSVAQVRRAVTAYRRAEHPPLSKQPRHRDNVVAYMEKFNVPVQDDGDQASVALRRDKCGPPRVKKKRTGGLSEYQKFVSERLRDKKRWRKETPQNEKMRTVAMMWKEEKKRRATAAGRAGAARESGERVRELTAKTGKIPKKKKRQQPEESPFQGASDIKWWE
jgi:hypothetical protein